MAPHYHLILWLGHAVVAPTDMAFLALSMVFCFVAVGQNEGKQDVDRH